MKRRKCGQQGQKTAVPNQGARRAVGKTNVELESNGHHNGVKIRKSGTATVAREVKGAAARAVQRQVRNNKRTPANFSSKLNDL